MLPAKANESSSATGGVSRGLTESNVTEFAGDVQIEATPTGSLERSG